MRKLRIMIREHLHFIVIITLLTLVMTYPTIAYVFRTDVFWHPAGESHDIFIMFWDYWFGMRVLAGEVDRWFTDLIYYPEGVSLVFHPLCFPLILAVNLLRVFMPLSNAYSLTYLLIIWSSAFTAYVYALWLCKDKWIALFGAIVFAFSPQIAGLPFWPTIAWIAPIPLAVYCFHRGVNEGRERLIIAAGLLTGLTSIVVLYNFVCLIITLGMLIIGLGASRLRQQRYWRRVLLLIFVIAFSSAWRLLPILQSADSIDAATAQRGAQERATDLISYFVNARNPITGPLAQSLLQTPDGARTSHISYLGFAPLALIGCALAVKRLRRRALPWLALLAVFLILRLGSALNVNGTALESILLPKHFLNQWFPMIFNAFDSADLFMLGARMPLAILACLGTVALAKRVAEPHRPIFIMALSIIVLFEYFVPVKSGPVFPIGDGAFNADRVAYHHWLAQEDDQAIRLVNLPLGRKNAKLYLFYQSLHGYPQTEGAISRPPNSAYDYIRANHLLASWREQQSVTCETPAPQIYLESLAELENDGFSHVVFHRDFYGADAIRDSFQQAAPSYSDEYVSVYRLSDLRESCPM